MATLPAPTRPALNVRPFFENKSRAFWTLQAVGWTGYLLLRGASTLTNLSLDTIIPVIVEAIVGYCVTLLLSTFYGYFRRLPRVSGLILTILAFVVATIFSTFVDAFTWSLIQNGQPGVTLPRMVVAFYVAFTALFGWSALYFGINFYLIVEDQIDQMQHLESQASSAQLAMLRYQLNPHFLFNTLNSISTLVLLKQTERANAMLSRLSSFLRYTLANEPTAHVTVLQEVETLKLYLEIEKMRFEDRLRPVFDVDPRAERARLPSLLLQPLVENAIKYAVSTQEQAPKSASARGSPGIACRSAYPTRGRVCRRVVRCQAFQPAWVSPILGSGWSRPMARITVLRRVPRRLAGFRWRSKSPSSSTM